MNMQSRERLSMLFLRFWKTNLEAIFIRPTLGECLYGRECDEGF